MIDRFQHLRAATEDALLRGPGRTAPELREAVASGNPPADLLPLVDMIRSRPYAVTDQDVAALRDRYSEDDLFEIIVAAAFGAARDRLSAAHRVLEDA